MFWGNSKPISPERAELHRQIEEKARARFVQEKAEHCCGFCVHWRRHESYPSGWCHGVPPTLIQAENVTKPFPYVEEADVCPLWTRRPWGPSDGVGRVVIVEAPR